MALINRKNVKHNIMCYLSVPSWNEVGQRYSYYRNTKGITDSVSIIPVLEKNDPTLCTVFLYSGKRYYNLYTIYQNYGSNFEMKATGYSFVYGFNVEGDPPSNFGIKHNWDNKETQFTNIKGNIIKIIKDTFASDPVMNTALTQSIKDMITTVFGKIEFVDKIIDLANKAMSLLINSHYIFPEKEIPSYNGFALESDEYTVKKVYCAYMSGFDPYAAAMEDLYELDLAPSLYGGVDIGSDIGSYCIIADLYYKMSSAVSTGEGDTAKLHIKKFYDISRRIFESTLKLFFIWAADHRIRLSQNQNKQGDATENRNPSIADDVEVYYMFGGDYDDLYNSVGEPKQQSAPAQAEQTSPSGETQTTETSPPPPPPPPQESQQEETVNNTLGNWLTEKDASDKPEKFNIGFFMNEDNYRDFERVKMYFLNSLNYDIDKSVIEQSSNVNILSSYSNYLVNDVYSNNKEIEVYSNAKGIISMVIPENCASENKNPVNYNKLVKAIYNPFLLKPIIIKLNLASAYNIKSKVGNSALSKEVIEYTQLRRIGPRNTDNVGSIDGVVHELISMFQMLLVLPPGDYNYIPYFKQLIEALYSGAPSLTISGMNYFIGYYGIILNNAFRFSFSNRLNDTILYLLPTSVKITASDVYVYPYTIRNVNVIGDFSLENKTKAEIEKTNKVVETVAKASPLYVTLTIDFRPINDYIHLYGNFLGFEKLLARLGSDIGKKPNTDSQNRENSVTTSATNTAVKVGDAVRINSLVVYKRSPSNNNKASLVFYNTQRNAYYAAKYVDQDTWNLIQELVTKHSISNNKQEEGAKWLTIC